MLFSRRDFLKSSGFAVGAGVLVLAGCSSTPKVPATGQTTEVTVTVEGMRFIPDAVDVPVGNELVVTLDNTGDVVHDLVFANNTGSAHLGPGQSQVIEVGVISADLDGWCSVSNHRAMGMVFAVRATE
ncbi:cupredoxin domain-containing protein [Microbacterium sp. YY-01]|uniref:cupredoxin domain-containing protein n=1 Tax=Microbacterium sp. YY-01 TaxID=3421634 RepID=UPI003D1673FC